MDKENKFNNGKVHRPSEYHPDESYKNLHKAALDAKEFLDYGLQSQRKYKKQRKDALSIIDYFSQMVNKFYTGTLTDEQYEYLLNSSQKKLLSEIKSGKAIGLEKQIEDYEEF